VQAANNGVLPAQAAILLPLVMVALTQLTYWAVHSDQPLATAEMVLLFLTAPPLLFALATLYLYMFW
jgi:hypothetical protein